LASIERSPLRTGVVRRDDAAKRTLRPSEIAAAGSPAVNVLFQSPLGALLARPWVDRAGLIGLRRWYFPLSRLWAAANASQGELARFRDEVGASLLGFWPASYLRSLLARNARLRGTAEAARVAWETAMFDETGPPEDRLQLLDRQRRAAATHHLANRASFYPLLFPRRPPPARWQIDQPTRVQRDLGPAIARPDGLYGVPIDAGTISVSRPVLKDGLREYWLRAPTPAALGCADGLAARCFTPASSNRPTRLPMPR
jgi:hypothetical protein